MQVTQMKTAEFLMVIYVFFGQSKINGEMEYV